MKKVIALAAALLTALCACADPNAFSEGERLSDSVKKNQNAAETFNYADGASEPPTSYNNYANAVTDFSLKLLRKRLDETPGKSVLCSPANTALTLSLLSNGASGDTKSEILLQFGGLSADDLNTCGSYFQSRMEEVAQTGRDKKAEDYDPLDGAHVSLLQNLTVSQDYDISASFLQKSADFYGADVIRVSFDDEKLEQKQRSLLSGYNANASVSADAGSSLYALTASSLTDKWLAKHTIEEGEVRGSGSAEKTSFMVSDESYLSTDAAEGIVAYTADNPLKFIAVVPKNGVSVQDYIDKLGNAEFDGLLNSMKAGKTVRAAIPCFSIDGGSKAVSLRSALEGCGLHTVFTDDAHWKYMNITDRIKLDDLYELPPSVTVSDSGILAEAQTGGVIKPNGNDKQVTLNSKKELRFDKPFAFFFIDNESNIPVYAGVYQ